MGLIADERSAMAHMLKTAGKARTWVAPGSAEKNMGFKSHPARSFSPRPARKRGNQQFGGLRAVLPGQAPEGCLGVRSPGNGGAGTGGTDDSWLLRHRYGRGYRGTLTLPRGPGPWPTPPAGSATAPQTPAPTAVRGCGNNGQGPHPLLVSDARDLRGRRWSSLHSLCPRRGRPSPAGPATAPSGGGGSGSGTSARSNAGFAITAPGLRKGQPQVQPIDKRP